MSFAIMLRCRNNIRTGNVMADGRIISKPTLAVIKGALVDLGTHSSLENLFERYEFERHPNKAFDNKLSRCSVHLDHHDWSDAKVSKRLLNLLTEVFVDIDSRAPAFSVEKCEACQRVIQTLDQRDCIRWDGHQFVARNSATLAHMATVVDEFSHETVQQEVQRLLDHVETDPADVLTSGKSLIESVCRAILEEAGEPPEDKCEFPPLLKQTLKQLELLPDQISDKAKGSEIIKRVLNNLGSILNSMGSFATFMAMPTASALTAKVLSLDMPDWLRVSQVHSLRS